VSVPQIDSHTVDRTPKLEDIAQEYRDFIAKFSTALLSTADGSGTPNISYAPTVFVGEAFYVYISDLAKHTRNLMENPQVALMFIEDEGGCQQIYARTRVILDCQAKMVEPGDHWHSIMNEFALQFGEIMQTLTALPDFRLLRLEPEGGQYVKGFGQAYRITGPRLDRLVHIDRKEQGGVQG